MGLEVEGSSPSTHLLWLIENRNYSKINVINSHLSYSNLFSIWQSWNFFTNTTLLGSTKFINYFKFINKTSPLTTEDYNFTLNTKFKTLNRFVKISTVSDYKVPNFSNTSKTFQLFKVFLNTSTFITKSAFKVHPSSRFIFLNYASKGSRIFSLKKLFNRWQDFYHLVFNIFFYKISIITFGTSFFKNELLTLNWFINEKIKKHWRYVRPYIFSKENKINDNNNNIFSLLSLRNINLSFVIDVNYHRRTIYYLKRFNFFTIGVVPISSDMFTVDFAMPSSSESATSQLFFIRLVLHIRRNVYKTQYTQYKKYWEIQANHKL